MGDVPGEYFVGRPLQVPAASQEPKTANTQIPGDYFIGTPENHRHAQQAPPNPNQSTGGLKRSSSSLPKWCCFGGTEVQN